ncbi:MAG: DUF1549 domain-containing protein, partial [Verrucomicrobia bacterium]|nr:DUF1549 domain-containing protein [Verrucomicrobiota bacterium]
MNRVPALPFQRIKPAYGAVLGLISACLATFAPTFLAAETVSFNRDIRPILAENCFYCHGQDGNKRKADLRLDVGEAVTQSGIIVPGEASKSALSEHVYSKDPDKLMPPSDSNRRLSEEQKELLTRWIDEGAKYESHWAFVPPTQPAAPAVNAVAWVKNPIDRFVMAKLEEVGVSPSPEADRAKLIKRLSIDLTGLPPTPEDVQAFISDRDEMAYEHLVDRLLDSRHYGERMALPWLDAARYADSNGFQQDGDTWQWMWRDWVVRALNDDLPFDQFTIWQLAGDLLPDATIDQQIASGFNRNHLLNGEGGAIAEEQRFVNLFDRIDTTATTWLGLTMACAQCHDHKYDPITQRDYYSMMDAFNHVPESGAPQRQSSRIRVAAPFIELPTEENKARIAEFEAEIDQVNIEVKPAADAAFKGWRAGIFADGSASDTRELPEAVTAILNKPEAERSEDEKTSLETSLRKHFDEKVRNELGNEISGSDRIAKLQNQLNDYKGDQIPRPMVMSDARQRDTYVLSRGEYL